ncbi:MAG: DUF4139 domain-containing protein [Candidatus Lokiarchaeota archaeon]|nr:DUF4139 domain-containing protein [Candidatus Lokiarchaeota archaeon]
MSVAKTVVLNIEDFPITHILLSQNNAIITRAEYIDIASGSSVFSIANLTPALNEASMHVEILEDENNVILQNPILRLKETVREVSSKEKEFQNELDKIKSNINQINKKIEKISKKHTNTKKVVEKTAGLFPIQYSNNNIKLENLKSIIKFTQESFNNLYESSIKKSGELDNLQDKKSNLEKEIAEIQSNKEIKSYFLNFTLVSPVDCKVKLQFRYRVPSKWQSSYDLRIKGEEVEVLMWGIIENLSKEDWNEVNLELDYTTYGEFSMARPKKINLKRGVQGILDEEFQKFGAGKIVEKKQTTQRLKPLFEKITVPEDGETHAYLMQKFSTNIELFYYFNASETDYVVIGGEFKNGPFDLLPGQCNYFRDGKIIGRGKFQHLFEANQIVRQPLAVEPSIIAGKHLIDQKMPKQKKFILKYRIHLINKGKPKKIEILDIIPVSNQPRSKIQLLEASRQPEQPESGVLRWNITLENEWEAIYSVEFLGFETVSSLNE